MIKRPLGQSGIDASVVSFGAWAIGGWKWGGTDANDSIASIHAALDAGIDFIDTAAVYGFGLSEELVGKAISDRPREDIIIANLMFCIMRVMANVCFERSVMHR